MHTKNSIPNLKKAIVQANLEIKDIEDIYALVNIGEWSVDLQQRTFTVSRQVLEFLALPKDTNTKTLFSCLVRESQYKLVRAFHQAACHHTSFDIELVLMVGNRRQWVRFIGKPQVVRRKISKVVGIFQNITQIKETTLRLEHHQHGLKILNSIAANISLDFDEQLDMALETARHYLGLSLGVINQIKGAQTTSLYLNGDLPPDLRKNSRVATENTYCSIAYAHANVIAIPSMRFSQYHDHPCYRMFGYETYIGAPVWVAGKRFGTIGFYSKVAYGRDYSLEEIEFIRLLARWVGSTLERAKKEQELLHAKKQAEEASHTKARFLSTMSHEIRTPMNAVIGITHLLLQNDPKPEQAENLQALKFSGENLLALINDILDFSKIEAGKIVFENVNFDITLLIKSIFQSLSHLAQQKGLTLEYWIASEVPTVLVGDPVRLSQVLNNLLSNAIKFTEKGSVKLSVDLKDMKDQQATLDFSVVDTGIGIPRSKKRQVFDRFAQASSDTTRKYGGTGLGLAITKKLLELQHSQIQLKSTVGKGTTFYFSLTFGLRKKQKLAAELPTSTGAALNLKDKRILLVEDNTMNLIVARQFLNKWGIPFDCAENGTAAVTKVYERTYDLILMDLQMPGMDGFEATKCIRKTHKQIPIIALSASVITETKKKVYQAGMNDFVTKPFKPDELYHKIIKYLGVPVA